ncbi:MAG: mannose-6-phosphate isomerase, class I [Corynebacterium sp.]|nr:mannose-6-phosphate isomerase, class I [Corynebacterium sp.]
MELLSGVLRAYPWGSRTAIAQLRGEQPSASPEAEFWFGAHPGGSSLVNDTPLIEMICRDPHATLGQRVFEKHGQRLPFLLKILAADEPLSLQAHPSRAQAEEGFERENAAGIEISDPKRNYKDNNHKPELIVALTDFEAMAGFRPIAQTAEIFDALTCPELERYRTMLIADPAGEADDLRALFTTWITIPTAARHELIDALVVRARRYLAEHTSAGWIGEALENFVHLAELYPGDVGVLGALLLNKLTLKPGEAIYLDAGQLHAYVRGTGVEIMANSDNVLRGGLTSKYVDVPELVRVLSFHSLDNVKVQPVIEGSGWTQYPVPIEEFALSTVTLGQGEQQILDSAGPTILLCTSGRAGIEQSSTMGCGDDGDHCLEIGPTQAIWIPAGESNHKIIGLQEGTQVFRATV